MRRQRKALSYPLLVGSKDDGFEYISSSDLPKNIWKKSRNTLSLSDDTDAGALGTREQGLNSHESGDRLNPRTFLR